MASQEKKQPLLDVESGGAAAGELLDSQQDDGNGVERKQIKLDMWRLLAEAKPQAFILCVATLALFCTAGLQLMIPWVVRSVASSGNFPPPPAVCAGLCLGGSSTILPTTNQNNYKNMLLSW